jgi:hypothetical protein
MPFFAVDVLIWETMRFSNLLVLQCAAHVISYTWRGCPKFCCESRFKESGSAYVSGFLTECMESYTCAGAIVTGFLHTTHESTSTSGEVH